jgi:AcrR family transcriptional regulator
MARSAQARKTTRAPDKSKARILEAAQAAFGTVGYARTGVREIAEAAGVAPSLVIHFFGSKEKLFEQAFARSTRMSAALSVARSEFGKNAVGLLSKDRAEAVYAATMLAQAIADPSVRAIAGGLLEEMVLEPLTDWLPPVHARGRAELMAMLTLGFAAFRLLVPPREAAPEDDAFVASWMERALQRLANGEPD